jgi:hypothetical protein
VAFETRCRHAPLGDDLIESAVEPRQRVGDTVGRAGFDSRRARARRRIGMSHAFELPRQVVETLVDSREVVIADVFVVVRLSV